MEKNDNTLLWIVVLALGGYVWWTNRHKGHPGGVNSGAQTTVPVATPATGLGPGYGGGAATSEIPVTITSQTVAGVYSTPGRLGNVGR